MGAKLLSAKKYDIQFLRVGFHSFKSRLEEILRKTESNILGGLKCLDKIYQLRNFT